MTIEIQHKYKAGKAGVIMRMNGRRIIAFIMAFIMMMSVVFQTDTAINGIAQAFAAEPDAQQQASDDEISEEAVSEEAYEPDTSEADETGDVETEEARSTEAAEEADTGLAETEDAEVTEAEAESETDEEIAAQVLPEADDEGQALLAADLINLETDGGTMSLSSSSLAYNGSERKPGVVVKVSGSTLKSGTDYVVSYTNNINVGTATVYATGIGSYTGTLSKTFTITQKTINYKNVYFEIDGEYKKYTDISGKTFTYRKAGKTEDKYGDKVWSYGFMPKVHVYEGTTTSSKELVEGTDFSVQYWNVDTVGAQSDEDAGPTIYISNKDGSNCKFDKNKLSCYFTLTAADMGVQTASLENGTVYKYTGKEIEPAVLVLDAGNGKELVKGTDYTVTYSDNIAEGTGTVTITGDGYYYTGSQTLEFTISKNAVEAKQIGEMDISIDDSSLVYDGTAKTPTVTIKDGSTVLKEGTDYTLRYNDNINVTNPAVTIYGKGSYAGTETKDFKIQQRDISSVKVTWTNPTYTGSAWGPSIEDVTVTDEELGVKLTAGTDFKYNRDEYNKLSATKYPVGKYTWQIEGQGNYTGSRTVDFEIEPADISTATITTDKVEYTGAELQPSPSSVTWNRNTLEEGTDYTVESWLNNVNVGYGSVIIAGHGNYTGTATGTFEIYTNKISMKSVTISGLLDSYDYAAETIKPEIQVSYDGVVYTEGVDYVVSYGENLYTGLGAGSIKISATDDGPLAGYVEKTFSISSRNIGSGIDITVNKTVYDYTGEEIKPDITVTHGNYTLIEGVDYTFRNLNTEPGTWDVWIYGMGNYTSSTKASTKIVIQKPSGSIAKLEYSDVPDVYYTGKAIVPELTIKDGTYTLKEGEDYTIEYETSDHTNAGTVAFKVVGDGTSYIGEKTFEFNILAMPLDKCDISYSQTVSYKYKANEIAVTIKNNGVTLTEYDDYTVEFKDNIDATEEAKIIITPAGKNYTLSSEYADDGYIVKYFTITPIDTSKSSSNVNIPSLTSSEEYTGKSVTKDIQITAWTGIIGASAYTLVEGKDYDVSYTGNTGEAGTTATVSITFKGNFIGSSIQSFKVTKRSISNCTIQDIPDQDYADGEAVTPELTIYNGGNSELKLEKDKDYTVSYANNCEVGTATVTIMGCGDSYEGSCTKTFEITDEKIELSSDNLVINGLAGSYTYSFGKSITPDYTLSYDAGDGETVTLTKGTDYKEEYKNNTDAGAATLTITGMNKYSGGAEYSFEIEKYDISAGTLVLAKTSAEYTGKQIEPAPTAISVDDRSVITDFSDFDVEYGENTDIGKAAGSVTVTAKDTAKNYTGTLTQSFDIEKRSIKNADITAGNATYTGEAQTPEVKVVLEDKTVLSEGTDYTVAYDSEDRTDAGTYSFTVTGNGNYTGSTEGSFVILPKSIEDVTVSGVESKTYTGSPVTQNIIVADGERVLVEDTDYTVTYSDNTAASTDTVKAKVVISGKGNYDSATSKEISFDIEKADISEAVVTGVDDEVTYSGKAVTFDDVELSLDTEKVLVNGTDYTVSYEDNENAGTARVIFTAKGNYTGVKEISFTINPKTITDSMVSDISGQETAVIPAGGVTPSVVVKDGSTTLTAGKDYSVAYTDNDSFTSASGKPATATITGQCNYTGEVAKTFTISKQLIDITGAAVKVADGEYTYSFGDEIRPSVTVTLKDGTVLDEDSYSVSYTNNTEAGTAAITVTGAGDYKGTATATFTISRRSISDGEVVFTRNSAVYTGKKITPQVEGLMLDGRMISADSFDVSCDTVDFVNAGDISVKLTALNGTGFSGSASGVFTITPVSMSDENTAITVAAQTYTGKALTPAVIVEVDGTVLGSSDYEVSYSNNTNATTDDSRALVTVTGKANYNGEVSASFDIKALDISGAVVTADAQTYTGSILTPDVVVAQGGEVLVGERDYTITYENDDRTDAGDYSFTVNGTGNYTGTADGTFTIRQADIEDCEFSDIAAVSYDGTAKTPEVTATYGGVTLSAYADDSTPYDYKVAYSNNINATGSKKAEAVVTGHGNFTGTKTLSFDITGADISSATVSGVKDTEYTGSAVVLSGYSVTYDGKKLTENTDYSVTYKNNTEVGTAVAVFSGKGNYTGNVEAEFDITKAVISDADVDSISGQQWTGAEVKPQVAVKKAGRVLTEGTDYTVTYADNIDVTSKDKLASATITAMGNYQGTVVVYFSIVREIVDIDKDWVAAVAARPYDFGNAIEPEVTIIYNGMPLEKGTDYTLSYSDNVNAGQAAILITGTGYFSGYVTVKFTITPISVNGGKAVFDSSELEYTGQALEPVLTEVVLEDGTKLSGEQLEGFTMSCTDNVDVGTAKAEIAASGNYSGTVSGSFEITAKSIENADVTVSSAVYTGDKLEPSVVVAVDGRTLEYNKDYTLSYDENTDAGTGNVAVTGKGNYKGGCTATFEIGRKSLDGAVIAPIADVTYTGTEAAPKITVTCGDRTLTEDKDYSVSYDGDMVNVGTVKVTVNGIGNYTGAITDSFDIVASDISKAVVSDIDDQTYTGTALEPVFTVETESGTGLVKNVDYTVRYDSNTDVGTAKVTITGKGNYSGSAAKTFVIKAKNISDVTVTGYDESVPYTGTEVTFSKLAVRDGAETLVNGEDYTVSYTGNSNVMPEGETFFTITGKGNYEGVKKIAFAITAKDIGECTVAEIESQIYTGEELTPDVTIMNGGTLLKNGTDYVVTYSNNRDVTTDTSKAVATITGKGNYTGSVDRSFVISKVLIDISKAEIGEIADQVYAFGEAVEPETIDVTYGGKKLVYGTDYTTVITNNVNAGTAKVLITGTGDYNKTAETTFVIRPYDISDGELELKNNSYVYSGSECKPSVVSLKLTLSDTTVERITDLVSDFDITYGNNVTEAGNGSVTLTAKADTNFTGSVSAQYKITAARIESEDVTVADTEYTGETAAPSVSVTIGEKKLTQDKDYTVTVSEGVDVKDTPYVVVTGKGNYTGEVTKTFAIKAKSITDGTCEIADAVFTGTAIEPETELTVDGRTLKAGVDYTVAYDNNISVTSDKKAAALIKGCGNYTGTKLVYFGITARTIAASDVDDIAAVEYTGSAITPAVVVRNGDITLVGGVDYDVRYTNNTAKTKQARAIITGKGNYKGTVTKLFEICGASIESAEVTGYSESTVYTGDSIVFDGIKVELGGAELVDGVDYDVTYEANVNATTTDSKAYIVIKGKDNYGGQIRIPFEITRKSIETCTIDEIQGQTYTGSAIEPAVTVRDGSVELELDKDYTVSYDKNVEISGEAVAIVTGKGNYEGQISKTFTIAKEVIDISDAVIGDIPAQSYNYGAEVKPAVTVTYNGKVLTAGEDYAVTYADNRNVGTATVTVSGTNQNKGQITKTFEITPIDITDAAIVFEQDSYTFTGNAVAAKISGIDIDGRVVTDLSAFTISFSDNVSAGTATATVTANEGQGFAGSVSGEFRITQASIENAVITADAVTYTGKAVTPNVTVILDGVELAENSDFTVAGTDNIAVTDKAQAVIKGTGNYTGERTITFEIVARNITGASVSAEDAVYTGSPVSTAVAVTLDGAALVEGTDYELTYKDNINVTTGAASATAIVKGVGNYTGTVSTEFAITAMDIAELKIADIPSQVYSGGAVTPGVTITNGDTVLTEGADYTLSYSDNDSVTTKAGVVITGKGNYKGSITKTFAIGAAVLSDDDVSGISESAVYTGSSITFDISVAVEGRELTEGTDYTVSYENNVNVTDKAEVVITGKGNYSGTVRRTFAITAKNIGRCSIDPIGGQVYTGSEVTPEAVVRDGARVLAAGTDYTVSYSNNREVTDSAELTVTGKGNYKGSLTTMFSIAMDVKDMSKASIELSETEFYYSFGDSVRPDVTVTFDGGVLKENEDYELVFVGDSAEGTATVIANGINRYTGSVSREYEIKPIDITKAGITLARDTYEYTGSEIRPAAVMITVDRDGTSHSVTDLSAFVVAYSSNTNVGTAAVSLTAKAGSGFTGSAETTFSITEVDISEAVVEAEDCVYTGYEAKPSFTVTLGGRSLVSGTDFTVSYSNNINVGASAMITITGKGNYGGTAVGYFSITAKSIDGSVISVAPASYTGEELTPAVTVTLGDDILNRDIDYTVSYSNNTNATTDRTKASVVVKGIGNYKGSLVKTFDIAAMSIEDADVSDIAPVSYTGAEIRPDVTVTVGERRLTAGTDYTISYSDNIEVSESAQVTITGKGNYTGSITRTFDIKNISLEDAEVTGVSESVTYTGKEITFDELMVVLGGEMLTEDTDYTVSYSDNLDVTDKAEVVITGKGNYSGVLRKTFAIEPKNIASCKVDAIEGQTYTGKAITPDVTVREGSEVLVKDEDYTVSYSDNIEVTSKALITITGKGNYTGTAAVTFAITKSENITDISKAVISKAASQYYNFGQELKPSVTVTLGGRTLTEGTDYALVYENNIEEGTAKVTAKGIGTNKGSVSATFKILPIDISTAVIALDAAAYPYTGKAVKPGILSFTVKRNGKSVVVTDFDGLDISYEKNTDVGTGKVVITAVSEEGFTGSVSKTFTITGASIDNAVVKVESGNYTGEAVTPDYTVTLGGRTLVEGTDYRADFSNNINATTAASLKITGKGNYSGEKTVTFEISRRTLADADITVAPARYTGDGLEPAVTVTIGGMSLVEGRDYETEYSDNVNVTTATAKASVTVTGKGNYTGTAGCEFDIAARDISLVQIKDIDAQAYTGNPVTPAPVVTDGDTVLVAGTDYTVAYRNNTAVTNAAVLVITGKGNYSGTASKTFAISGASIENAVVEGVKSGAVYTGKAVTFAGLKVRLGDDVLTAGTDYTVSYSSNRNVTDKAGIVITGKGNYTGSKVITFAITAKNIADDDCHVSEIGGQVYTGYKLEPEILVTYGDITLTEDVDYEITYENNIGPASADAPATASIKGIGNYTGQVERSFTITKNAVNIASAKISVVDNWQFSKTYIRPEVTVTYGDTRLTEGTDYKVSYANNYNAGNATVYVTGYGDYVGTKTASFTISKRSIDSFDIELEKTGFTYTGKSHTPKISAVKSSDGAIALDEDEIAELVVQYRKNVNAGDAEVTVTAGSTSNYTGSITTGFTIEKADLYGAIVTAESSEYTGSPVTPAVTVTKDGRVLSSGDYTCSYADNTEVGSAEVKVEGTGNYKGTVTAAFAITARSLKNCDITCTAKADSESGQTVPVVVVKNGSLVLDEDKDYILSYDGTVDAAGRARVVITGQGNYKDSVTKYYTIEEQSIESAVVTGVENKTFTGSAIAQDIAVTLNGIKLTKGTDYVVAYANNIHVGTASMTITGKGNYKGSIKRSFVINRADISDTAVIEGISPEVTYSGTAYTFSNVKITWGSTVLKKGTDYTITYKNNSGITMTKTGKASCTIKFIGDYKGSVTKNFRIKAFDISKAAVKAIADQKYTGKAVKPAVEVYIGTTKISANQYEVKYSNNVNPGEATVTITGLNNFYGTCSVTFNILPANVSGLKFVSATTSTVDITWSKLTASPARGYVIYRKNAKTGKYDVVKYVTSVNTLKYRLTGLSAGSSNSIGVAAYVKTSDGKVVAGAMTKLTVVTAPGKAGGITYTARTDRSITLRWNSVSGATGYRVYYKTKNGKTLTKQVAAGSGKTTSVKITGLSAVTSYTFCIKAYKRQSSSIVVWGGSSANKAIATTPGSVRNLRVTKRSNSTISLSWNSVSNADGYYVYKYNTKTGKWNLKKTIRTRKTTTFVGSQLAAGTTHKYKVVAYKYVNRVLVTNAGSTVASITTPATPAISAAAGANKATVAWRKVSGASGYVLYMSTSKNGKYTKVKTLSSASVKYVKTGLKKGNKYYFKLVAYKTYGGRNYYSGYSTVKSVTVK